jgi:hypothetical protein
MSRENIFTGVVANDGTGDTLKLAMTKTNNNFTELYTQVTNINKSISNTWVSPQTSNTYTMVTVSGATRVTLPSSSSASVNTVTSRSELGNQVYVPRNTQNDAVFMPLYNGDVEDSSFLINVDGDISPGSVTSYSNTEWVLVLNNGPISYTQGDSVAVSITYIPNPQAWFDPDVLGYTNFRGAKISYHAFIDNSQKFNEVGEIFYTASDDSLNYNTQHTYVRSRNSTQSANLDYRKSTNKLHYRNTSIPAGNLHIQWHGTVWTGQDR